MDQFEFLEAVKKGSLSEEEISEIADDLKNLQSCISCMQILEKIDKKKDIIFNISAIRYDFLKDLLAYLKKHGCKRTLKEGFTKKGYRTMY